MSLLIPFDPAGLDPKVVGAFDDLIAGVQTWAGKKDADGKWQTTTEDPSTLLRIDGTGNTWTIGQSPASRFRYVINGDSMRLNVYLANSSLTVTSATTIVAIRLPGGYMVAGNAALNEGPAYYSVCYILNNAINTGVGLMTAQPGTPFVYIQWLIGFTSGGAGAFGPGKNFVTSTDFTILGQIEMEVTRS